MVSLNLRILRQAAANLLVHSFRDWLTLSIQELAIVHRDKSEAKLLCKRRHRVVLDSMDKGLCKVFFTEKLGM